MSPVRDYSDELDGYAHLPRIVRAGHVVRIPPELPHEIESIGQAPLRLEWLTGDTAARGSV